MLWPRFGWCGAAVGLGLDWGKVVQAGAGLHDLGHWIGRHWGRSRIRRRLHDARQIGERLFVGREEYFLGVFAQRGQALHHLKIGGQVQAVAGDILDAIRRDRLDFFDQTNDCGFNLRFICQASLDQRCDLVGFREGELRHVEDFLARFVRPPRG